MRLLIALILTLGCSVAFANVVDDQPDPVYPPSPEPCIGAYPECAIDDFPPGPVTGSDDEDGVEEPPKPIGPPPIALKKPTPKPRPDLPTTFEECEKKGGKWIYGEEMCDMSGAKIASLDRMLQLNRLANAEPAECKVINTPLGLVMRCCREIFGGTYCSDSEPL